MNGIRSNPVALVTGGNRGVGRAFVDELLARGASKVYVGVRDRTALPPIDDRVVAVELDITDPLAVQSAADMCSDTSLLINNAGAMLLSPFLNAADPSAARAEMETNYFGTLAMCKAFAPILAANGGGALINMLSVTSWYAVPFNASYCASKSAEWAMTNALRIEMRSQGTLVVGVHAGFIDTDMAATVAEEKISPQDVARQTLDAIEDGREEVITDDWSRHVKASIPHAERILYPDLQRQWDAGSSPWRG